MVDSCSLSTWHPIIGERSYIPVLEDYIFFFAEIFDNQDNFWSTTTVEDVNSKLTFIEKNTRINFAKNTRMHLIIIWSSSWTQISIPPSFFKTQIPAFWRRWILRFIRPDEDERKEAVDCLTELLGLELAVKKAPGKGKGAKAGKASKRSH